MATNAEQHYSLRWNDYTVKIVTAFQSLRDEEDFVDVTVACDGHHYSAHKMVLSACSPYFRSILRANPCQHPIVILKDVGHIEMERLLEFMYNGEVNIAQDQLAAFLKTAESLRIRGLAGSSEELDQNQSRDVNHSYSCLSSSIGNTGISGRISPTVNFSQECKDDDITSDGVFHINSPAAKRRKRTSDMSCVVTSIDNSTSHITDSLTGDSMIDGTSGGDGILGLENHHMDSRELKSEPSDMLGDVYSDASELAQDQQLNDGLPGPSGSAIINQDGGGLASNGGEMWYPRVVLRSKQYLCPFCEKCFTNRQSRSRHVHQKHAAGLAGTCSVCGHVYTNLQTRCAHTRIQSRKISD